MIAVLVEFEGCGNCYNCIRKNRFLLGVCGDGGDGAKAVSKRTNLLLLLAVYIERTYARKGLKIRCSAYLLFFFFLWQDRKTQTNKLVDTSS